MVRCTPSAASSLKMMVAALTSCETLTVSGFGGRYSRGVIGRGLCQMTTNRMMKQTMLPIVVVPTKPYCYGSTSSNFSLKHRRRPSYSSLAPLCAFSEWDAHLHEKTLRPPIRTLASRKLHSTTVLYRTRSRSKVGPGPGDGSSTNSTLTDTLDWEKFDFSISPKHDERFNNPKTFFGNAPTEESLEEMIQVESIVDRQHGKEMEERQSAWDKLSPDLVESATHVLEEYVNAERKERMADTLSKRTVQSRFLFENPTNPSNVWACLRTIDSFGIQKVDIVLDKSAYTGVAALNQKRGMRTAMGSAKWLTLRQHPTTEEAVERMKQEGYKIYASDLNPESKDVRDIDWCAGPICVVMGNEDRGISDKMRSLADLTFTLPMVGFAESFNLSVATAITLAHMSSATASSSSSTSTTHSASEEQTHHNHNKDCVDLNHHKFGPLHPGGMDEHERNCLWLKWLLSSMPNKKIAKALLNRANIKLPINFNSI